MPNDKAPGIDKNPIRVIKDCINPILPRQPIPQLGKLPKLRQFQRRRIIGKRRIKTGQFPYYRITLLRYVKELLTINLQNILRQEKGYQARKVVTNMFFSTETSLINITDSILNAIDQKKVTALVLLDMSKAFDCVNHNILTSKLQDMGASQSCLQWFSSYLSNRQQVVRINSVVPIGSFGSDERCATRKYSWTLTF